MPAGSARTRRTPPRTPRSGSRHPSCFATAAIPAGSQTGPQPAVSFIQGSCRRSLIKRSLNEARIRKLRQIRDLLDDADLEQEVGRLLRERVELAGEEGLVGGLVLPAQIFRRVAELLARLLHIG